MRLRLRLARAAFNRSITLSPDFVGAGKPPVVSPGMAVRLAVGTVYLTGPSPPTGSAALAAASVKATKRLVVEAEGCGGGTREASPLGHRGAVDAVVLPAPRSKSPVCQVRWVKSIVAVPCPVSWVGVIEIQDELADPSPPR